MNDVIYRKVMTVPEAGAQLGLGRNASYAAAKRGDIGRRLDSGASLLPPALIIQDELHLISGPLGTVAALYEVVLDRLATRRKEGKLIRPKVVASTATVRRASAHWSGTDFWRAAG